MSLRTRSVVMAAAVAAMCLSCFPAHAQTEKSATPAAREVDGYETVRISRPDGTVTTLLVPRNAPLRYARTAGALRPRRDARGESVGVVGAPKLSVPGARGASRLPGGALMSRAPDWPAERGVRSGPDQPGPITISDPRTGERRTLEVNEDLKELFRRSLARTDIPADPAVGGDDPDEWRTGRGWRPEAEDTEGGGYIAPDTIEVVHAGVEFGSDMPPPDPMGDENDPGYDAEVIARWNVVPDQTISGDFEVGIVAFHMNGVERVDFWLEGGPRTSIRTMQTNPRTGVREYVVRISGDDVNLESDEPIELRAVAYPEVAGTPRLLPSLNLYVNNGGGYSGPTLYVSSTGNDSSGNGSRNRPLRTIQRALNIVSNNVPLFEETEIVILRAGRYDIDQPSRVILNERWLTIRGDESLSRDDVVIASGSSSDLVRPNTRRLRFSNLTLDFGDMYQMYKEDPHAHWYDGCVWTYGQGWTYVPPSSIMPVRNVNYGGLYVTDCESRDSIYAFVNANLVRNSHAYRISGDVFQNSLMVVNSSVSMVDGTVLPHHSDLLQYFGNFENLIVYNVNASFVTETQNIFLDHNNSSFTNCAFVNVAVQNTLTDPPFSQLNSAHDHVLFQHVTNPGQRFVMRDDFEGNRKFTAKNVFFRNCVVERLQAADYFGPIPEGVHINHCHFNYDEPRGLAPTVGPIFLISNAGGQFEYKGIGEPMIRGSAAVIRGYSRSGEPDRGAAPWDQPR